MEINAIRIGHSKSYPYFLKGVRTDRRAFTTHPFRVSRHLTCDEFTISNCSRIIFSTKFCFFNYHNSTCHKYIEYFLVLID